MIKTLFAKSCVAATLAVTLFLSTTAVVPAADKPVKPLRVLLILGGCCHDYAHQKDILKNGIEARAQVQIDIVYSQDKSTKATFDIYKNPDWAKGYDAVIHDECSADVKDMPYVENILKAHQSGIPAVNLHCAMHCYRTGTDIWFKYIGIQSNAHGPQEPIALHFLDTNHPITKGMEDWTTIREELYNNIKIFDTATPLVRGKQMVKQKDGTQKEVETVVAWLNQYGKTRVFNTTIGHNNDTVGDDRYLNLVTRGLLWACDKLNDTYLKPAPKKTAKVVRVNLAQGKPARASSEESNKGNVASKAFDADSGTRWCASGPRDNEWLQVDLGKAETLTGCRIEWEFDNVPYYYKIEGSTDGNTWKVIVDASKNDKTGPNQHDFMVDGVRYLRITYLGKPNGGWGSIREFEVFGTQTVAVNAATVRQQQDADLLKDTKAPPDFETTIFARPPMVNYPVFVSAAPDGTVYVSSDGNGSLDRAPHRGRILRLRDTDGDGRADEVKEFVKDVDSPRGLIVDHDRVYLMHPPNLSVYIDKDGDGIADEEKVLIKGIGFTFKDRPADHTSNGLELGVDGWIYCAIGDFGFRQAEGTDGRTLQLRGGGVVRVRPDGTGMELYARGTRNILETPVSPLLDLFARDNTNDGGGWDTRFHHFTGLENHGYPSLFKNFSDEIIQPLADYGGGGACGAAWIEEPGIPAKWNNGVLSADWGRSWVYHMGFTPKGATYSVEQTEFFGATRTTDVDVDALSHIYISSWKGATFTWVGPEVGYLVRLTPKGYTPETLPNFDKATDSELIQLLESPSHRRRLEAQRTLLRRGLSNESTAALTALAANKNKALATRVAALFAVKQGLGAKSIDTMTKLANDSTIAAWAIRALTDRDTELAGVPAAPILAALKSADNRTRKEAVVSLARLGKAEHAQALTPLLADSDPVIAHTAVQALKRLKASDACFAVVDTLGAAPAERAGALRALQSFHETSVVDGLIARLNKESDLARRKGLLTALCRLYFTDGEWKGDSWGTRPDTSGPYYQAEEWGETKKIADVLKAALAKAKGEEASYLVAEFSRHKIQSDDALNTVVTLATKDASLIPAATGQLARADHIPANAIPLLIQAATAESTTDITRSQAVMALAKTDSGDAFKAILTALPMLESGKQNGTERERRLAREAFLNSPRLDSQHGTFEQVAAKMDDKMSVWADSVLLKIADRKGASPEAREAAQKALDTGWADNKRRTQILLAVAMGEHRPYKDKVLASLDDPDKNVAQAAHRAASALRLEKKLKTTEPMIASLKVPDVVAAVLNTRGDVKRGEQLFSQQGCVNCHTAHPDEPLRGPYLGNIATTYKRPELAENILLPNKTIAQGFITHHFEMKDGEEYEGFVTLEAADKVTIRNAAAQEIVILVKDIAKRTKLERSIMPEGLAANLTVKEFASLLDYLEMLAKTQK